MANYNKVILIGNLTRDPELRYSQNGLAIAKLGLAVNRIRRDAATSEVKEEVTFVDLTAFDKQAETLGKSVRKGSPIMIEGRLKMETWEDKQTNQKRSKLVVIVEGFQFLGPKGAEEASSVPSTPRPPAASPTQVPPTPPVEEGPAAEDDVPF
jgi:single-strand DNA-binding protein